MKIHELIHIIERHAPRGAALQWDNVGLQLGDANQEITRVLLALDVTPAAVEYAISTGCNCIVSHHPLIFKPIKSITHPLYLKLIQHGIVVYSAHTNLDVAQGGVNHALAQRLGLQNLQFLTSESGVSTYHMVVYVPQDAAMDIARVVIAAGAGRIGHYSDCLNSSFVDGQYRPLVGSTPFLGKTDELERVVEQKLEFFVDSTALNTVITAMKQIHPYETPVYAVYPQQQPSENFGLGLVGVLAKPQPLSAFADAVKAALDAPMVQCWSGAKDENTVIRKVAVCGGSGSSVLRSATAKADVLVTGELTYHHILDSRLPLILGGHFYTEQPVLSTLEKLFVSYGVALEIFDAGQHEIQHLRFH